MLSKFIESLSDNELFFVSVAFLSAMLLALLFLVSYIGQQLPPMYETPI